MRVSLIIPAFNEEKLIGQCLESVKNASEGFHRMGMETEVIVCDNNSTDRTAEMARAAGAKVVFEPVNQISRARNAGAAAATGQWLVFIDADSFPSAGLFGDVAAQIQSGRCLAGGSAIRLDEFLVIPALTARFWNLISRTARWAAGSFIFCETTAFRQIGGFSLELYASEEIELSRRLKRLAKADGRKMVILHRHPLVTSARKVRLYSALEHLRFIKTVLLRPRSTLKDRDACVLWYNGRR